MTTRLPRIMISGTVLATAGLLSPAAVPVGAAAHTSTAHAPATRAVIPPNFDVSARHGNEAENDIAINPTKPSNIVAMSTLNGTGLFEGVSFDGGKSWTRKVIGTSRNGPLGLICCDEQLAWDRFGDLWMTYLVNTNGNTWVALSTDGGLTFTKAAEIVPTSSPGSKPPPGYRPRRLNNPGKISADQPSIAVGKGSVWVSYTGPGVIQAAGARVTGLGKFGPFSKPESVPTSHGSGDFGDTAVGPAGQVMVTYQDFSGKGKSSIYTALDANGLAAGGFTQPRLLARTRVLGFDPIPAQPHRTIDAEANLAWDYSGGPHSGRVYAVWTQETPVLGENNTDIMFQYSDDNGATWTHPALLNTDHSGNSQFNPAIAVDQSTGDVAVSWYDCRNDSGVGAAGDTDWIPNDDMQVWATYSFDGGVSFAPNFRVSAGTSNAPDAHSGFDYGDYTHAAFADHLFYPAWSDNSNSAHQNPDGTHHQLDLFTAKVVIP
ncbi:MAG TPA: sialidase family protein [Streptosporangiaceae bacterium]|nr:sialidase family protein [Streptosporangiaceae bacterium]